jgi:recombination protein RecA
VAKRLRLALSPADEGESIEDLTTKSSPSSPLFIPTGSTLLDCVLGGGWGLGRFVNIVGDKSTGKTLLAIEACANFIRHFPGLPVRYMDAEAAFDPAYAEVLGFPTDEVELPEDSVDTVEEFAKDFYDFVKRAPKGGLYILDSLDSLSDTAEQKLEIGESGGFNQGKPKAMNVMFRRINRAAEKAKVTLMLISQTRDKIGVIFGEKQYRAGGRALDFYASQIVWLAHKEIIKRTINNIEREIGIWIKAKNKKNKMGVPFRFCELPILFNYGIDDVLACLYWLEEIGLLKRVGYGKGDNLEKIARRAEQDEAKDIIYETLKAWKEIEDSFADGRKKYENGR